MGPPPKTMPLLDIENLYPWNCCPVGFLEMLGNGLVSERPHPPHPPRAWVQGDVFGWYVCKCKARYHPTPPTPPTPCMGTSDVFRCSASNYVCKRKLRYHPTPPPTPPTPCIGTSDPNEAKWSQFLVASDREVWSQVTACTVEVLLALSANVTFCGRKWPHFVVTSDPNPVFLFVVASDRILWSQVTAMPHFKPLIQGWKWHVG